MSEIGPLFAAAEQGDASAANELFARLYSELHRLAKRELSRRDYVTLSATTLLHEAYLNIAGKDGHAFPDRDRFMHYAARVMRGLIVDHARNRHAQKRGGAFEITSLEADVHDGAADHRELERISAAIDELAETDESLAGLVDLKFFCGFSFAEIGAMRGVSERTVQRQWEKARIFLYSRLRSEVRI